jgi:hypothetical protein
MLFRRFVPILLVAALMLSPALAQEDPFGSIAELKLAKPEDGKDVPSKPAPAGAVVLFDGNNLDAWVKRGGTSPATWKLIDGVMQVNGGDIVTKEQFDGSFQVHVEFRTPYMPKSGGQGRGNSGVYLQGRYEVQVLDSYGIPADKLQQGDCGGIYGVAKPPVNVCKPPTVWQSYDIDFRAPVCKDGEVVEPARMSVIHNGVKIHDDVKLVRKGKDGKDEIVTVTTSGDPGKGPCTPGPILLQDHGNPVQFRNVWLVRK